MTTNIDPWRTVRILSWVTLAVSIISFGLLSAPLWIITVILAIVKAAQDTKGSASWICGTIFGLPIVCTIVTLTFWLIFGGFLSSFNSKPDTTLTMSPQAILRRERTISPPIGSPAPASAWYNHLDPQSELGRHWRAEAATQRLRYEDDRALQTDPTPRPLQSPTPSRSKRLRKVEQKAAAAKQRAQEQESARVQAWNEMRRLETARDQAEANAIKRGYNQ
jgi:hypothetical protein